ncbi:ATP-binding protein [Galbitalea sp. SE-J8]|uniref:ATP-binding protein n=1 Tax=Galbitalea sp. SE-J8 TaxID=3054952 RepID=UPI00259C6DF3|nr:ATP-binding protein [Galbitalea sp. SE-J8]MDM4762802.1 ATP-binding protein [Galbitalea sp. SE-J8]
METGSIAFIAWARSRPPSTRMLLIAALVLLELPVSSTAVRLSFPGAGVASFWPAAGLAVVAALLARRRVWPVALAVFAVTLAGNLLGGRVVESAVLLSVGNALEALIVSTVLTRRGHESPELRSVGDVARLLLASTVGALPIGVLGSVGLGLTDAPVPLLAFVTVVPSHIAAVLIVAPIALIPPEPLRGRPWERVAQPVVLAAVLTLVLWPSVTVPLEFVVLPALVWAAFRLGLLWLCWEMLVVAIATVVATAAGTGPFAQLDVSPQVGAILLLGYLLTQAAVLLLLAVAQVDRERLARRAVASERLLRSGLEMARVGLVLIERTGESVRLLEANQAARAMLVRAFGRDPFVAAQFDAEPTEELRALLGDILDRSARVSPVPVAIAGSGHEFEAYVAEAAVPSGPRVVTVQLIDVTERRREERALHDLVALERRSADRLRAINAKHEEFIASVSHELRTPLTSIQGYAEELADERLREPARGYVEVIGRNARRLAMLVGQLLASGLRLEASDTARPVADLAAEAVEDVLHDADTRGVRISIAGGDVEATTVRGDSYAVILANLVSNALKYARRGDRVSVELEEDDAWVTVRVADTGPGIPPHLLETVFDRFYRVDPYASASGTGLGLSIVRTTAEEAGGSITLQSDGVTGTTAIVRMPRERVLV